MLRLIVSMFAVVVVLIGCAGADVIEGADAAPGVINASTLVPESLHSIAADVRATGGAVLVVETVSVDGSGWTEAYAAPVADLFERYPTSTFTLRVTDNLGAVAPTEPFSVTAIVGPVQFVDGDGNVRTDWVVAGGAPPSLRMPVLDEPWVLFGTPGAPGFESVMRAATLTDGMVSGEFTRTASDVPLDELRL